MDKENLTAIFNYESEIGENGEVNFPAEKLKELHDKGFKKVNIVFFGSSENAASELDIDLDMFNKIKDLQGLPDTVVLDFLTVKGALKNSKIEERIEL